MAVCVKAVWCGGVEMKLHKVLLTGCVNCTRMYLPFSGNYSKSLFSSVTSFSSRMGGTRTLMFCARTVLHPLKLSVQLGNRKLNLSSRNYSDVCSKAFCSQTLPVSRCQPRRSLSAVVRKENLLQGGASWPGKNEILYAH